MQQESGARVDAAANAGARSLVADAGEGYTVGASTGNDTAVSVGYIPQLTQNNLGDRCQKQQRAVKSKPRCDELSQDCWCNSFAATTRAAYAAGNTAKYDAAICILKSIEWRASELTQQ